MTSNGFPRTNPRKTARTTDTMRSVVTCFMSHHRKGEGDEDQERVPRRVSRPRRDRAEPPRAPRTRVVVSGERDAPEREEEEERGDRERRVHGAFPVEEDGGDRRRERPEGHDHRPRPAREPRLDRGHDRPLEDDEDGVPAEVVRLPARPEDEPQDEDREPEEGEAREDLPREVGDLPSGPRDLRPLALRPWKEVHGAPCEEDHEEDVHEAPQEE